MSPSNSQATLPREEQLLREHHGIAVDLPTPAPLDLCDLPIVLASYKQGTPGPDGRLPPQHYEATHQYIGLDGSEYRVKVVGDPSLGLPYGNDLDILLALFRLVDENRLVGGVFPDPSLNEIARAMGKEPSGKLFRRIREALGRFGNVRITSDVVHDSEQLALAIQQGQAAPVSPSSGRRSRNKHSVHHLLNFEWHSASKERRRQDGAVKNRTEHWVEHLSINPVWVQQAVSGWAAFLDVPLFIDLTSPLSKRLYMLLAGSAARGVSAPWTYDLGYVSSVCAMAGERKPYRLRDSLLESAEQLKEARVLLSADWISPKRGTYTLVFEPGQRLDVARWLRGIGLLDLEQVRTQVMCMAAFGISPEVARGLIYQDPEQVLHSLTYAIFLREEHPERIRKSWAGFLVDSIRKRTRYAGDEDFSRWLKRERLGAAEQQRLPAEPDRGAPKAEHPSPEGRKTEPCTAEPADAAAAAAWRKALGAVVDELPPLTQVSLGHLAPSHVDGGVFVCFAANDFYVKFAERHTPVVLPQLRQHFSAEIERIEVRPHRPGQQVQL